MLLKQGGGPGVASLGGPLQGSASVDVLRVPIGADGEQGGDGLRAAIHGGQVQRGGPEPVATTILV